MRSVSELTREMVAEYEMMMGRKLTPMEYLEFRNQAAKELNMGLVFDSFNADDNDEEKTRITSIRSHPVKDVAHNRTSSIKKEQAVRIDKYDMDAGNDTYEEEPIRKTIFDVIDSLDA